MMNFKIASKSIVIQIQSRSMSDPLLSDIDFKNKMVWTTSLNFLSDNFCLTVQTSRSRILLFQKDKKVKFKKDNLPTSMWKVRELVDKATNVVMNYTETEAKVREATNDDPWGPSGTQMRNVLYSIFKLNPLLSKIGV